MIRQVKIYRSARHRDMYLYVDFDEDLQRVPQALLARFGVPIAAMTLELEAERKLARADAATVLRSIEEAGYYLQMPPSVEARSH
jgi:uncharacterized protein YcgL (UPF0745 family)